jgi:hypothetical protein
VGEASAPRVTISYTKRQAVARQFWQHTDMLAYGGAAGGGKTGYAVRQGVEDCLNHPGLIVGAFRRNFPDLENSIIKELLELCPQTKSGQVGLGRYNAQRHTFHFDNGSLFRCCYSENERDVYQYLSQEFHVLIFDEATQFTWPQVEFILTRWRVSKPGLPRKAMFLSNPRGVGHAWFKEMFIDLGEPERVHTVELPAADGGKATQRRVFIPSRVHDNPYLMQNDPDYVNRLMSLPDPLRRAYLYGDWNLAEGAMFPRFGRHSHVVAPVTPPFHWRVFRAVDFGYNDPLCCLWLTENPETGQLIVFRELYEKGLGDDEAKARITSMSADLRRIDYTVADTSGKAKQSQTGLSTFDYWAKAPNAIVLTEARKDRVVGWQRINTLLEPDETGQPRLVVARTCVNLIRELENALTADNYPDDLHRTCSDHALDALRYACMSRQPIRLLKDVLSRKPRVALPWRHLRPVS